MIATVAFVSDCDCVRKSRLRSKLFPFARWLAMWPSGFWITLKIRIDVVEDRVDLGVGAVRRRREPLDES